MRSSRFILLLILLGVAILAWAAWRNSLSRTQQSGHPTVIIEKQPVAFANHTFDPNSPPAAMPALAYGEEALCDSNFSSSTSVGGESQKTDATHARVTITKVKMTLNLSVNIWVPVGATQHVAEHEDGHRQISEYYYDSADKLAKRVASSYLGKQIDISGADLDSQLEAALHQTASDITSEYDKEISFASAQQYYDQITDHGRNDLGAKGAVTAALQNIKLASFDSPATTAK